MSLGKVVRPAGANVGGQLLWGHRVNILQERGACNFTSVVVAVVGLGVAVPIKQLRSVGCFLQRYKSSHRNPDLLQVMEWFPRDQGAAQIPAKICSKDFWAGLPALEVVFLDL